MKRYVVTVFLTIIGLCAYGQFDSPIGQYMYNISTYNPAAVGEDDLMKANGSYRLDFTGLGKTNKVITADGIEASNEPTSSADTTKRSNSPKTGYFCFQSPFMIGKTRHGIGVRFLNDQFGLFENNALHIQYAYRQRIKKGYLSAGIELGFMSLTFKGSESNLGQMQGEYHQSSDKAIPTSDKSGMKFDMGVGVYYTCPNWYVGASYSHITQPVIELDDYAEFHVRGTMYVVGGYNAKIKNTKFALKPSVLLMTDFASWNCNLTMLCEYKDRYRWGVGYSLASSFNILLGIDVISGLSVGYTYELTTSKLLRQSYGSHEIYLAYGFNVLKPKRTNQYKSIRYL